MTTTAYTADRTALLIVDHYSDFMSKGGKLYEAIRETAEAADALRYLVEGRPFGRVILTM
jgi:nicotinamidase-related amidase